MQVIGGFRAVDGALEEVLQMHIEADDLSVALNELAAATPAGHVLVAVRVQHDRTP